MQRREELVEDSHADRCLEHGRHRFVVFLIGARIAYQIAMGYIELEEGRPIPRYRLRTWLRGREPDWLYGRWVIPKGPNDCGTHEFYNDDGIVDRCYHCVVGLRLRTDAAGEPAP